jgi:uncharacterized protein involved in cysteine biosynthesis
MQLVVAILIVIALGAVVFILGWGLVNMFRGGSGNLSERLMRARVLAQFVAILLLLAAAFLFAPKH